MATPPKPLLSTREWGGVILLAVLAVAAGLAYVGHSTTLLEWLQYGPYVYVAWALLWLIPKWRRRFQEGRQHGGPTEGIRRVLGPGPTIRVRLALLAFVLVGLFGVRYLQGALGEVFSILFVIGCLGLIAYFFLSPWAPREGRASGVYRTVVFLLLVASLGLYLGLPLLRR